MYWLRTLLVYNNTDSPFSCKIFHMYVKSENLLDIGLVYKVGIDPAAVLMEAVSLQF